MQSVDNPLLLKNDFGVVWAHVWAHVIPERMCRLCLEAVRQHGTSLHLMHCISPVWS